MQGVLAARAYDGLVISALGRAMAPAAVLGAMCGGVVRLLAEAGARQPGALGFPRMDFTVVLVVGAVLVAVSALTIRRLNRAASRDWAWRGAMLAWPAFALAAAVVAGPVFAVYVLGLPLLLVLAAGLLATGAARNLQGADSQA